MYPIKQTSKSWITLIITICFIMFSATNLIAQYSFTVDVSGEGKPLIFIPGLISGSGVWDETVDYFAEGYACHRLTLAGFAGQAPIENGPYLEKFRNDIIQYINDHQLQDVTIVGHSLGGFLALLIGLEDIEAVESLVVVDALPFLPAMSNPHAEAGFNEKRAQQYYGQLASMSEVELRQMWLMTAQSMCSDSAKWEQMTDWFMASDLKTEAWTSHEMMGMDLRTSMAHINIPVLLLVPFQSNPYFPDYNRESAELLYRGQYAALPQLQMEVVEDAKHFVMFDQPELFMKLIKEFINKQ